MLIRLGHSPDPDDAFMFWALAEGRVDTGPYEFEGAFTAPVQVEFVAQ